MTCARELRRTRHRKRLSSFTDWTPPKPRLRDVAEAAAVIGDILDGLTQDEQDLVLQSLRPKLVQSLPRYAYLGTRWRRSTGASNIIWTVTGAFDGTKPPDLPHIRNRGPIISAVSQLCYARLHSGKTRRTEPIGRLLDSWKQVDDSRWRWPIGGDDEQENS